MSRVCSCGEFPRRKLPPLAVHRDPEHDERDTHDLDPRRQLKQHSDPDDGRGRREQGHEERVRCPGHTRHRELVADVWDDGRGDRDPDRGAEGYRVDQRRRGAPAADRRHDDRSHEHGPGQAVDAAGRAPLRDPVGEDDVDGEERRVHEGEDDSNHVALDAHVDEQVDARRGGDQGEGVAGRARPGRCERDNRQELDRRHRGEREPVDRHVEARVHDGQHGTQGKQQAAAAAVERGEAAPRPAPERVDRRRARDAKPRRAQRLDAGEEEDGERRAEVVEDGAADEERGGRGRSREAAGTAGEARRR